MKSIYRDEKSKDRILELYIHKLNDVAANHTTQYIQTEFGKTHIVFIGDKNKKPLIVLHGANGNAAVGAEPLIGLLDEYYLISIDVHGQPNLSDENRLNLKTNEYAKWLDQLLEVLEIDDVTVYGMSFGGFIVLKAVCAGSNRIKKAILHAPAGIVNGDPIIGIFKALIPMKLFMWTKKKKYLKTFLELTFTQRDEFTETYLQEVILNLKMDFTPVPTLSKKQIENIKTPLLIIAADQDVFFPGKKIINRLKKHNANVKSLLLEDSKHVIGKKHEALLCDFILKN